MCWAALVGDSVLTLCRMDEDHYPRTTTGESYSKMLCKEAGRSREGWVALVVVTTGQRRTPLHQKSGILGGKLSWTGDFKVGGESSHSPDLSQLLLGVRKCQGLQAAAHYDPTAQGDCRGSRGKPQR